MVEFRMERSEFLYMLSAAGATRVVGIDPGGLWPTDADSREKVLADGEDRLLRRGLLLVGSDGSRVLDLTLIAIITAIAHPDRAALVTVNLHRRGPQLVVLYQSGAVAVEQTFPGPNTHRLALLGDATGLLSRLWEVLDTGEYEQSASHYTLAQHTFFEVNHLAGTRQQSAARALLLDSGLSPRDAESLSYTLSTPDIEATAALLQCRGHEITDARDVALASGGHATWSFHQRVAGEPMLIVENSTREHLNSLVEHLYDELAPVASV